MRVVTKIPRQVGTKVFQPGDECDIDDAVARVELAGGRVEHVASKAAQPAPAPETPKPAAEAAKPAPAPAAAKASTEVKPVTTADGPNQGEYATRDLKAKG